MRFVKNSSLSLFFLALMLLSVFFLAIVGHDLYNDEEEAHAALDGRGAAARLALAATCSPRTSANH